MNKSLTKTSLHGEFLPFTERSLALACTRGREAIVARFRELLSQHDLTEQQWRVLRVLYDFEPMASAELCRLSCIHKVSMARILKALSARGLARRVRSQTDLRGYQVSLTAEGRRLLDKLTPISLDIYVGITEALGKKKTQQLLKLLQELAEINTR